MKSLIKFEIHHSTDSVNFLDVTINLKNGVLNTDLYCKPTDAHLYLNAKSSHPQHVIRNIPKGQFIRLRRICSDTTNYIKHSRKYIEYFTDAGYNSNKLKTVAEDVLKTKRNDLLNNKIINKQDTNTTFVCTYHPKLDSLPLKLQEHYKILESDHLTSKIFKEKPLVAFRKSKSIQHTIVRNDINPKCLDNINDQQITPCTNCKTCKLLTHEKFITTPNNRRFELKTKIHCRAKNIVYAAKCKHHKTVYVGHTGEELRTRFNKHRYDAKKRPENNELAKHIFDHKHDFDRDIELYILQENLPLLGERTLQEDKWVCLLGTLTPTGLNVDTNLFAKEMYSSYQKVLSCKNH